MNYVTYTTTGGENWGFIANKAYGNPFDIKTITDANPTVELGGLLPAGIVLKIPVKDVPSNVVDQSLLPFWKREASL